MAAATKMARFDPPPYACRHAPAASRGETRADAPMREPSGSAEIH